ncbi:MAG: peptidase S8 [Sphingomonadales bacterium]|nr:MAG: peptidase S8 [Sphingomonadales bacterium]
MNALVAYNRGGTGSGIKVGVIDSGIDLQSAEFGDCSGGIGTGTCRIASLSQSTAGNTTIDDEGGHGTAVAFTIAGRRNGTGTHGVSFDAQLIVIRADSPGSCASETAGDEDSGCDFADTAIARGLDVAREGGARVVNISLGGSAPNATLIAAINRATAAGIVIVMSAGNDGPNAPNPDEFTAPATDPAVSRGLIIIAGSVNDSDTISTFSNRAGASQQVFLSAVGERVRAPDQNDTAFLWSGTSFSAPQIAGAVALLAQAFPNLTGAQIVQLLLTTARDVGAPGTDAIYGRGVLDLTRAFQPVGTTSLAGSRAPTSENFNAALSAPMGDAGQGALGVVVLDGFDRAFATDLARTIRHEGPARQLPQLMASRQRSFSVGANDVRVAVSLVPTHDSLRIERLGIGSADAGRAKMLAGSVIARMGGRSQFAIGASEGVNTLSARLAGAAEPAFLVSRDPTHSSGFDVDVKGSAAARRQFGSWGVTLGEEAGDVLTRRDTQFEALRGRRERFGYFRTTLGVDRAFGGLSTSANLTHLRESDTLLGARFSGALGATRADSVFLDLAARYDLGDGWSLGGSMRQGWTQAHLRGGVQGSGMIRTNAFAADFGKAGLFRAGDRFGIRVAQPLRVATGGIDIRLPGGWDYYSQSVDRWNVTRFNLAPTGREMDFELAYSWPFPGGDVSSNFFLRRQPGNFAAIPVDRGAAMRVNFGF